MKKIILLCSMSLLFIIGLTSMASMDPPNNTTCNDQCEVLVDRGVFSTHGVCMSACNTCLNPSQGAGASANCFCHQIGDLFGYEAFGFNNHGDCVKTIKAFF